MRQEALPVELQIEQLGVCRCQRARVRRVGWGGHSVMPLRGREGGALLAVSPPRSHVVHAFCRGLAWAGMMRVLLLMVRVLLLMMRVLLLGLVRVRWLVLMWRRKRRRGGRRLWLMAVEVLRRRRRRLAAARAVLLVGVRELLLLLLLLVDQAQLFLALGAEAADVSTRASCVSTHASCVAPQHPLHVHAPLRLNT